MDNSSVTQESLPGLSAIIAEVERLGFEWELMPQYDTTQLDMDRRVQCRETKHYAPRETVQRYAVQMAAKPFPPILVTRDKWIVDGNTRIRAKELQRKKGGDVFFPAVVLHADYENASRKQQNLLHALASTFNASNGVALTNKESREDAVRYLELGWKHDQIEVALGLTSTAITQVRREIDAKARLNRVGITPNGQFKDTSLRALGTKEVLNLTDAPYRELATLTADAGLSGKEITTAAKEARATGSESGALEKIETLRTELNDRIREKTLTGRVQSPLSRKLREHLTFVTDYAGREDQLIETDPKVNAIHIETIGRAIDVLNEVLRMQQV